MSRNGEGSRAVLECSSSDEDEVLHADFLGVSLQLFYPSEWKLAAYGGFFREENFIVIGALSFFLYSVRFAVSPPDPF